ncbi:hypothetical protein RQP46_003157 [Phenoliferia psychrophenolica]
MYTRSLVVACLLPALASAWSLSFQSFAAKVLGTVTYLDYEQTPGFGLWAQIASEKLSPLFKNNEDTVMTILVPNTEAFENWIVANGGNSTAPESLTTKEWETRWNGVFEYLFFKGTLNSTSDETVVLASFKQSPVGAWPLTVAFRREAAYEPVGVNDTAYNGTINNALGGVNISLPDSAVGPNIMVQVEPQNLSVAIAALNISSWEQVCKRISAASDLETQRNFTLFLPPESATVSTVGGQSVQAQVSGVVSGSVNASIVSRDIFTNGGIVQSIDRSLVESTAATAHSHYTEACCGQRFASPPMYDDVVGPAAPLPLSVEEIETLEKAIDGLDGELRKLSMTIHDNPEIAWKEFKTHDVLCDFMQSHGFKVTRHAYGLETAWEATFEHGSGGPVVGFNSEMIGHACGHNLIAIAGVAASLGVAAALKKHNVAGKIILLGVPAEEQDGGKINMINAGAYKPMGACFMLHPAPYNTVGSSLAIAECVVEYTGHTAHAAAAPWEAINAQDAAVLAYNNISALRQQTHPTHRIHGIIINENWVQNVIPGSSKIVFAVRAPTMAEVEVLKVKVANCFEAAALATGCDYKKNWVMSYADLRNNRGLIDVYQDFMKTRYETRFPIGTDLGGSTDFGNVSYEVPALHPMFQIPCGPGEGNHTIGFTAAAALPESHQLTLKAAKGISVASWKFLTDKEYAASVKHEFKKMKDSL